MEEILRHQSKSIKAFHHAIYLHDLLQQGRLEVSHVRFCKVESIAAPFLDCVCGVLRRNRRKPWQELIVLDIKGRVRVWRDYHGDVSVAQVERFFSKLSGLGNILRQQHVASPWLLSTMVCALCKSGWLLDKLIKGSM